MKLRELANHARSVRTYADVDAVIERCQAITKEQRERAIAIRSLSVIAPHLETIQELEEKALSYTDEGSLESGAPYLYHMVLAVNTMVLTLRRYGWPTAPRPLEKKPDIIYAPTTVEDRFWEKVDRRGPDECWNWTGYRKKNGVGFFAISAEVRVAAHLFAYELTTGVRIDNRLVPRSCNNPSCCNWRHVQADLAVAS